MAALHELENAGTTRAQWTPTQTAMSLLALDALALRVITELQAQGVQVLLMKGPVTAAWLWDEPRDHVYSDVDLLVSPDQLPSADATMRRLGFRDHHAAVLEMYRPSAQRAWISPWGIVDLHTGLVGIPQERTADAWQLFVAGAQDFLLHGRTVKTLGPPARTLQLALHAAVRRSGPKASADLARGLATLDIESWRQAAALAHQLDAAPAFAAALRAHPRGREVLTELAEPITRTSLSVLNERGGPSEALAIAELAALPRGTRLQILRRWLGVENRGSARHVLLTRRLKALARLPLGAAHWGAAAWAVRRSRGGHR